MECRHAAVSCLSWTLVVGGVAFLLRQTRVHTPYGRYTPGGGASCPAGLGWFLQEVPAFLLPLLLLLQPGEEASQAGRSEPSPGGSGGSGESGRTLLLCCFMLHYFHRSVVYSFLTRGRPVPLSIVLYAAIFCSFNGFLQGHHLLHCARLQSTWTTHARITAGLLLFLLGMVINIHSDHILRGLRKPGETVYRIPHGGMFEFVSGANFLGEILEWIGFAVAAWSFPSFAFAFFTVCSIGPRAVHHHRDYMTRFEDYPRSRRALLPFVL